MEKLDIRFLKILIVVLTIGIASPVLAGTAFRFHPKAPVIIPPKPLRGYMFGYGGFSYSSDYNTGGTFVTPTGVNAVAANAAGDGTDGGGGGGGITTTTTTNAWSYDQAAGVTSQGGGGGGGDGTGGGGGAGAGGGAGGGVNPATGLPFPLSFSFDQGWSAGFGFGLYSGILNGSRFEIEGSYDRNDLTNFSFNGVRLPSEIQLSTKAVMVNWLKEFHWGSAIPYTGVGIGYASTHLYGQTNGVPYNDSASGFAYQFIAGIDIPITERLAFFTQYRYRVLSSQTFESEFQDFRLRTVDNPSSSALVFGARVSF
tara:strand:- start:272 stop:1210 length:939 start_codon:yes stop_codon:yes gene_type:complete